MARPGNKFGRSWVPHELLAAREQNEKGHRCVKERWPCSFLKESSSDGVAVREDRQEFAGRNRDGLIVQNLVVQGLLLCIKEHPE